MFKIFVLCFLKQPMQNVLNTLVKIVHYTHANDMNHLQFMKLLKEIEDDLMVLYALPCSLIIKRALQNLPESKQMLDKYSIFKGPKIGDIICLCPAITLQMN